MRATHRSSWDVYDPNCPSREVLDLIARRWTVLVIGALTEGPQRFGQLRRKVGGISAKVLTQVLRELARNGLVTRTLYPEIPPHTEYALTEFGQSLVAPLGALRHWAVGNMKTIVAVRASEGRPARGRRRSSPARAS